MILNSVNQRGIGDKLKPLVCHTDSHVTHTSTLVQFFLLNLFRPLPDIFTIKFTGFKRWVIEFKIRTWPISRPMSRSISLKNIDLNSYPSIPQLLPRINPSQSATVDQHLSHFNSQQSIIVKIDRFSSLDLKH